MTGFGRASTAAGGAELAVEVRSVNGRFADVSVRVPHELGAREATFQSRAREVLERGKISVNVRLEAAASAGGLSVDTTAVRSALAMLERVRSAAGIDEPIRTEHLLQLRDLFMSANACGDVDGLEAAATAAFEEALAACAAMRASEGDALATDLRDRLDTIERHLERIAEAAPERLARAQELARERVRQLVSGTVGVDPERLELEVALLADRLDITEELVRLRSHLGAFRSALDDGGAVGRRLNFISQELNREINTIGSKANDAEIGQRVVAMKEELEKIREQVQNVV